MEIACFSVPYETVKFDDVTVNVVYRAALPRVESIDYKRACSDIFKKAIGNWRKHLQK